jgi:hypothetical protein
VATSSSPLTDDGHLDGQDCVQSIGSGAGEDDAYGHLFHYRGHRRAFHCDGMDDKEEEEPIFPV